MDDRDVYQDPAEATGAGGSNLIPKIFAALPDEDEARILLAASPAHGDRRSR